MTLQELRNKLLGYFCSNTYYDSKSVLDCDELLNSNPDLKNAMILEVLRDLEGLKIIRKCIDNENGCLFWVLDKPISSYDQDVTISAVTASIVADTINNYRASNNITNDFCDKLRIKEDDIHNLCVIIGTLTK